MKSRTRRFLAKMYDCDTRTLKNQLHEIGITHSKKLMPNDLNIIKERLGDWEK